MSIETSYYDLVVIGSGPGGYVGAIRASQLGMKTACIERNNLGGVCLNWGCIPTKALLHNAELYREAITHGSTWGIEAENVNVNWDTVIGRSRKIAEQLGKGVGFLFKKHHIDHINGHATIVAGKTDNRPCQIKVRNATDDYYRGTGAGDATQMITADRVLVATGAAPVELPFAPFDGTTILSSYHAMALQQRPESMVVVGSGAIGMEFADFFSSFGIKVTVVEMLDRVLPVEDHDISKLAHRAFKQRKITLHVGSTVNAIEKTDHGAAVTIVNVNDDSITQQLEAEVVLVAVGVKGRFDGLFDDSLNVKVVKSHLWTDYREAGQPTYQTSVPGIYAIGDVIGPPWLAHVASEEAIIAVERMAGHTTPGIKYDCIPGCTFCTPQIASVGMTEHQAQEQNLDYTVGSYHLRAHGKAIAIGAPFGLVKLIIEKSTGKILGCHIIGESASEMIGEVCLAKSLGATASDLMQTMHAHPTMHEALHEAALATEERAIHG